jgi:hypothetical protein
MKFIVKTNVTLKQDRIKELAEELEAMLKNGVVVLDNKFEYPPIIIDDGEPSVSLVMKTRIKKPSAGEHFFYNGIEFVALGEEQGGILAVVAERLEDKMSYDEDGCNDWRKSSLRKYLNEEFVKNFDKGDLLPFVSDLTSDNGMTDYGTSEDFIALLSDNLYRKYRKYMPQYDTWVWTITPWSCLPGHASIERNVYTSGALHNGTAGHASGVAPACIFNPSIFE